MAAAIGDVRYSQKQTFGASGASASPRAYIMLKMRRTPTTEKFHEQQDSPVCIGGHLTVP